MPREAVPELTPHFRDEFACPRRYIDGGRVIGKVRPENVQDSRVQRVQFSWMQVKEDGAEEVCGRKSRCWGCC